MTFHLPGGRSLVLAGAGQGGLWLLAGGIALALLLVLYREERRLVSRRAGLGLVTLRVLAALTLVAALFEPIAARTVAEVVRGRVVIATDASASMETADSGRGPDAGLPRREVARRLIDGPKAALGSLGTDHDVRASAFGRGVMASGPLADVAAMLLAPGKPDDPARLATDWTAALAPALEGTDAAPVLGVVLVTDGRSNHGDPAADLAARLKARGVPVYPVLVGSESAPRDVAIAAVRAPETVQKGDVGSIVVAIKADSLPAGTEVGVTLTRPGVGAMRQTVRVPGDGSRPVASVSGSV